MVSSGEVCISRLNTKGKNMTAILQDKDTKTTTAGALYLALELSNKKWKLCFSNGCCHVRCRFN